MPPHKIRPPSPAHSVTSDTDAEDEEDDDRDRDNVQHPASPVQWASKLDQLSLTSRRSPVSNLPAEILIHVLKQVGSIKDLHSALLVSRTWCECSVELLWHKPHFGRLACLFKLIHILSRKDQTFTYARFIRRLNFAALGHDLSDQLFTRLATCTRLERLTLVGCDLLSDDALQKVLSCTPNLVALDLTGVTETTDLAITALAQVAPMLQGINLGGCNKVTDVGILAIAFRCRLLRRIKLSGVSQITDSAVIALATNCPLLIEVDLHHCERITDISVRELWLHSTNLRELRVAHCEELSDLALPVVLQTDRVNPFAITSTVNPRLPSPLPPLQIAQPFTHLRQLDLTGLALLTDEAVAGIVSNAPRLRNLVLAKCVRLTDAAVESICKLGRHLHFLHLGHAACITDRSICTLARTCTRLRYIDLACCTLLTDISVFELSALPKLRRIGLVRVANLTDQAIHHLADRHHTLERIHLSYCENISVPAIHFLLQKLHRLTHLSLTGIPAFRRPELQKFCRQPPKDFTPQQREAFCVYSGRGVNDLRRYLESIASPLHLGGDDSDGDISGLEEEEFPNAPYPGDESSATSPGDISTTPTHTSLLYTHPNVHTGETENLVTPVPSYIPLAFNSNNFSEPALAARSRQPASIPTGLPSGSNSGPEHQRGRPGSSIYARVTTLSSQIHARQSRGATQSDRLPRQAAARVNGTGHNQGAINGDLNAAENGQGRGIPARQPESTIRPSRSRPLPLIVASHDGQPGHSFTVHQELSQQVQAHRANGTAVIFASDSSTSSSRPEFQFTPPLTERGNHSEHNSNDSEYERDLDLEGDAINGLGAEGSDPSQNNLETERTPRRRGLRSAAEQLASLFGKNRDIGGSSRR